MSKYTKVEGDVNDDEVKFATELSKYFIKEI